MKTDNEPIISSAFTLVGTVVGAGFVSGRELLFFLGGFSISTALLTALFFFAFFLFALSCGNAYDGFDGVLDRGFKKASPIVRGLCLFSSFVTASGMLSAVKSVFVFSFPVLPVLLLLSGATALKYGVNGLTKINLFLTPTLLISVLFLVVYRNAFSAPQPEPNTFGAFFYAVINAFTCFPVLCELGKATSQKTRVKISGLSVGFLFVCILLVLSAVCSDKSSFSAPLPLEYVLNGGIAFSLLVCTGMATTFFSAFFTLYSRAKNELPKRILLCSILFICSYIPFSAFVEKIYPTFGVFGIILYAWLLIDKLRLKIKSRKRILLSA